MAGTTMAEYAADGPENRPLTDPVVQEAYGQSEAFLAFQESLSRVARIDRPVLIIGERGTGKELAASRLHFLSPRWKEPFVALNCAALASTLIEAELFGHEEGAFTGATRRRSGRFEAANEGTLFLDEIGNIPVETQEKILRVVEYGSFERVGSSRPIQVDARIIGATNADLSAMVEEGTFMQDLLDRLSFEVLFLPPLRARREDIMLLAQHFGSRMAYEIGWSGIPEFTPKAVKVLENYDWPGNVRELKNVVERAVYRSDDNIIEDGEIIFDPFQSPYQGPTAVRPTVGDKASTPERPEPERPDLASILDGISYNDAITSVELCLLKDALECAKFNQRKAAELMGLTYHQFRGLYRKHQDKLSG
jgi:psp operon transcriptional activator